MTKNAIKVTLDENPRLNRRAIPRCVKAIHDELDAKGCKFDIETLSLLAQLLDGAMEAVE